MIRTRILQWVGLDIGVTNTLEKLANHVAKTAERKPGSYPKPWLMYEILALFGYMNCRSC